MCVLSTGGGAAGAARVLQVPVVPGSPDCRVVCSPGGVYELLALGHQGHEAQQQVGGPHHGTTGQPDNLFTLDSINRVLLFDGCIRKR